jgi:hypothetical protein
MSYSLPSGVPADWRAAVGRAAQLLAPVWTGTGAQAHADLPVLAVGLYTLAVEQNVAPADVSLTALRDTLAYGGSLNARIFPAMEQRGQGGGRILDSEASPLWRLLRGRTVQTGPMDMGCTPPMPSEIEVACPRLETLLAGLTDDQAEALPPAPAPPGPLELHIRRRLYVKSRNARVSTRCHICEGADGIRLVVDGPNVTLVCTEGHRTVNGDLTAIQVRYAISMLGPRDHTAPDGHLSILAEGVLPTVDGDLYVSSATLPIDDDPMEWAF